MTAQGSTNRMGIRATGLMLLCLSTLGMGGCFTRRKPEAHFPMITLEHPIVPSPVEAQVVEPPEIAGGPVLPPPQFEADRGVPAKPRMSAPTPTEPVTVTKPPEPMLAPELSAAEVTASRSAAERSLDQAERNLALASGRKLNNGQEDLVSKVRGFAEGAREAMRSGDWRRARNLAKKAEVLSAQLAASL